MTIQPSRMAWTTLITNSAYLAGLFTMYRTLKAVSKYPLVVMVSDTLPPSSRELILAEGLEIVNVNHLLPSVGQHPGFDPAFARFNDAWTKLRVFGLTQFDRLILIDSDMIFLKSLDELFDLELPVDWIAASPACVCNPLKLTHYPTDWIPENCALSKQSRYERLNDPAIPKPSGPRTSHLLNSGLVVLTPSQERMDALEHLLNNSTTIAESRFADQDVITEAFHGRWRPLPWWCNGLKTQRAVHPGMWADEEVRLIHYILDKPWARRPEADYPPVKEVSSGLPEALTRIVKNSPKQQSVTAYDEVHAWWWTVYDEVLRDMQRRGVAWQEVEAGVTR